MTVTQDKRKRLDKAIKKINEGGGRIYFGNLLEEEYHFLSTPFSTLNGLIGRGFPRGRFTTVVGPEHTGKGAFLLQLIAYHQAQDPDFIAMWTDAESSLDLAWAEKLGVDLNRLAIQTYSREADTMEKLLQSALDLVRDSSSIDMWVIDSIAALLPQGDAKKTLEGDSMLNLQRKMGEFFRKANIFIRPEEDYPGCAVILVGQVYNVPTSTGVSLTEVRGGNAVKHWAHLRLAFRRGPRNDWPAKAKVMCADGVARDLHPGWSGRIKLEKTRINEKESQEILLRFYMGRGFDSVEATVSAALGLGLIVRRGAIYENALFPEGKVKGKEAVFTFFKDNQEGYRALSQQVSEVSLEEHVATVEESNLQDKEEMV